MEPEIPVIAEPVPVKCRCCLSRISFADQFCPACGFPLQASREDQDKFIYARGYKKLELKSHREKVGDAERTLYILAAIFFISGLFYYFGSSGSDLGFFLLISNAVLAVLFLLLGYWSKKSPIASLISGLVLYLLVQILSILEGNFSGLFTGIIFKALIVGYMVKGLVSALEAERLKKQHHLD